MTGRSQRATSRQGGWPELGSVLAEAARPDVASRCRRSSACRRKMQHTPYNSGKPGFLGPAYAPFQPNGEGKDDLVLQGISLDRLGDRKAIAARRSTASAATPTRAA